MGIFKRLGKIGEAEANALINKLEDPIKMTEQGIRELKEDLDNSLKALAEVKALAIRSKHDAEKASQQAADYEKKAMLLIQKAQSGALNQDEADRLAAEALRLKDEALANEVRANAEVKKFDVNIAKLDTNIDKLKANITKFENELKTLKARAKVSDVTKNVNKQLAEIDSSDTISMLERMKGKVEEDEILAQAYEEIADEDKNVDDEIDNALEENKTDKVQDALAKLKAKMAAQNQPPETEQ